MLAVSMVGFLMNMAFVRISRRVVPWTAEKK
jgi:ABC-type nitrate/sulfonate/bicarbonate transport system permease component